MAVEYDYLCVLDFEATCDRDRVPQPQEIIEFPVVLLNARTLAVEGEFHHYVRPEHHPRLTPFCTELTGIQQETVDAGTKFAYCLELHRQWLVEHGLLPAADGEAARHTWLSVSCGIWDHDHMLPTQCAAARVRLPEHFKRACDVKRVFREVTGHRAGSMPAMLADLGLPLEGRHHSGIDDARNIARIAAELIRRGAAFRPNWEYAPNRFSSLVATARCNGQP